MSRFKAEKSAVEKRMFSEKEARSYLGLGRNKTRDLCSEINAVIKVGGRVLYDKTIIDKFLDNARKEKAQ